MKDTLSRAERSYSDPIYIYDHSQPFRTPLVSLHPISFLALSAFARISALIFPRLRGWVREKLLQEPAMAQYILN
jgi:hypothetical protein